MSLGYASTKDLRVPDSLFNADGLAVFLAHGGRYGGRWVISAMAGVTSEPEQFGSIQTGTGGPGEAVDTAFVWVRDACAEADLKIVHFEILNHQYPPDQAPFFCLARFVVAHKDWT